MAEYKDFWNHTLLNPKLHEDRKLFYSELYPQLSASDWHILRTN